MAALARRFMLARIVLRILVYNRRLRSDRETWFFVCAEMT